MRLSAESLDQLLQSTGQLLTENLQQETLGRELAGIRRQLAALQREWESLQRTTSGSLRRLEAIPEWAGVGRYLDFVEHEVSSLSRRVRAASTLQKQSAWSVKLLAEQLQQDVRRARMVPAESEFHGFRKMMRDLARDEGKEIEFRVSGLDVLADRMVLQALKDPLMHILRNAVSHGIEPPAERVSRGKPPQRAGAARRASRRQPPDDHGRGRRPAGSIWRRSRPAAVEHAACCPQAEAAARPVAEIGRLLFQPGFSTAADVTELSGRGMGLSVAYETVTRLQGEIELRPRDGAGTTLCISVPLSISTHRLLLVTARRANLCDPARTASRACIACTCEEVETVDGQPDDHAGRATHAARQPRRTCSTRPRPRPSFESDNLLLVVLRLGRQAPGGGRRALVAERNALIKPLGPPADALAVYVGGVLLEDGSVSLVLNPAELVERHKPTRRRPPLSARQAGRGQAGADDPGRRRFVHHAHPGNEHAGNPRLPGARRRGRRRGPGPAPRARRSTWSSPTSRCRGWTASACWRR